MKTISSAIFVETEEKKSRFLACLMPYEIYEQELEKLRKTHPKANHHVSAFRYFDSKKRLFERAKDDGEPSESAGMPALKVLQGANLVNIAVIITRYFGGIKLGKGGMARAYGASVKAAIASAPFINFAHQASATLYASFDRTIELQRLLNNINIMERRYTESGIEIDITQDEKTVQSLVKTWEKLNY
jgi:uncharacterized YigZ family protein